MCVYICIYIYIYTHIICTIVSTIKPPLVGISSSQLLGLETHPVPPNMNQAFGIWVGDGGGIQYLVEDSTKLLYCHPFSELR